jgi:hypothetical protein
MIAVISRGRAWRSTPAGLDVTVLDAQAAHLKHGPSQASTEVSLDHLRVALDLRYRSSAIFSPKSSTDTTSEIPMISSM